MLDAMRSKKLVITFAQNQLKRDYLLSHPAINFCLFAQTQGELVGQLKAFKPQSMTFLVDKAYAWAKSQSWNQVYKTYSRLWRGV